MVMDQAVDDVEAEVRDEAMMEATTIMPQQNLLSVLAYGPQDTAREAPLPTDEQGSRIGDCFENVWKTEGKWVKLLLDSSGRQVTVHPSNAFQVLNLALRVDLSADGVMRKGPKVFGKHDIEL